MGRPLVLYVTGWCRSGTTLIGNLLNELDGVVHVGELHYLWHNAVLGDGTNSSCGCGSAVAVCPLWRRVLDRVAGGGPAATATAAAAWARDQRRLVRTRHTAARLADGRLRPASPDVRRLAARTAELYDAVAAVSDARVVVDTSKYPAEAAMLERSGAVDLRVLHVVRDPRATAWSWLRPKDYIPAMGPARSTGYWTAFNLASELVGAAAGPRSARLRYEDFVAEPRRALADVLRLLGLDADPPVDADGVALLGPNHTVTGNPDRMRQGVVRIRPDERWRTELPPAAAATATAMALPLLPRYGYAGRRSPVPAGAVPAERRVS